VELQRLRLNEVNAIQDLNHGQAMVNFKPAYGVGILGNCCTHGAGAAGQFLRHPETQVVTGFESKPDRAGELQEAMQAALASCYEEVIHHPDVQILVVTSDPCDKADLVEQAAAAKKPIFINKPLCHSPSAAQRIEAAIRKACVPAVFDAPMIKQVAAFDKLLKDVRNGRFGQVISYYHTFGMLFQEGFPIQSNWPERFDPAAVSGGGEMTNMGCYAIDYAVQMLGMPEGVEARSQSFWKPYVETEVENYGQLVLDYGRFWAILAVGKQAVRGERSHRNALTIEFENGNLFLDPDAAIMIQNGKVQPVESFLEGHGSTPAIDQLLRCIEHGEPPDSDVATAARGVEVLCAGYRSALDGSPVGLPLQEPINPLFE